ncbi:MAG: CHAT domain-containing tetratricopeptide repeat protein, partial [bacterium]
RQLEVYLQSESAELMTHLRAIAGLIEQHFGDSWYLRQISLYSGWDATARERRSQLLRRYTAMLDPQQISSDSTARELAEDFLGLADTAAAAKVYYNGGVLLNRQGKIEAATELLGRSLALSQAAGDLAGQARAYHSLGILFENLDSLIWAGDYFDSALTLRTEIGDSLGIAACLNHIGVVYLQFEKHTLAQKFFEEALRLRRRSTDSLQIIDVLLNLIESLSQQESESTVLAWLNEAESLSGTELPRSFQVRLLQAQALVAQKQGDWQQAQARLAQALATLPDKGESRLRLALLIRQAALHNAAGEYDQALAGYLEAYDLAGAVGNSLALADILHNLGATAQRLGQYESAADYYREAVNRNRHLGRVCAVVAALGNLIEVYLSRAEPELAERYLQELQTTAEYCDDPQTRAQTCLILAQLISPAYLDTARQYYEAVGNRQGLLRTLIAEAESAREDSAYAEAAVLLDRAAVLVKQAELYENRQRYELARGLLDYDSGQLDSAYQYLARVIGRLEATRRSLPETRLRAARQSSSRFVYEKMTLLWWQRLQAGYPAAVDSLLYYLESAKSRTLLDLLAGEEDREFSGSADSLRQNEAKLLHQLENFELQAQLQQESPAHQAALHMVDSLSRQLEQVRLRISLADPASRQVYQLRSGNLDEIRSLLPDSSTLVLDYLLTPESTLLLALDSRGQRVIALPSRPEIAETLIRFLALLRGSATVDSLLEPFALATDSLTRMVLAEIVPELGSYHSLLVSPDGPLAVLPFGALRVDSSYFAEQLEIMYIPSLQLLEADDRQPPRLAEASLLAVAVPEAEGMASLRYSREEVDSIARLFDSRHSEVLIGDPSAKKILQSSRAREFDFLHFATHSSINHDDPLRSRLWLSADTTGNLASLSLAEVMHLRLNAELVVLSSCESGGGRYRLGEGIEGFVRGFLYAGADRVLVSLWPVEDLATMEFMIGFYDQLGRGYGESLRATKLKLIHSARLRLRHPYYWSPFVLITAK